MYSIIRSVLFQLSAEKAHYVSMNLLKFACSIAPVRSIIQACLKADDAPVKIGQLQFRNAVGLGAGFDKNARYLRELATLGFGSVEIGTVTPVGQEGNPQPRLFRLKKDDALINRMGFNNDGVEVIVERLKKWRQTSLSRQLIVGGNIGKNKVTPNEEAWKDYEISFKELHPYVDYFVVNVSSPNTPGLRELQEKDALRKILMHLQMINNGKAVSKPIFLKIAPDLTKEQTDDVIDLALEIKLDGLVVSNTTLSREGLKETELAGETGGVSGRPVMKKSTDMLHYIIQKSGGAFPVIASGGIFSAEDAEQKIAAGASLVQIWTGFIYKGPALVKQIAAKIH